MNMIERQATVARQLIEINLDATRKMIELTGNGMRQYMDLNSSYFERMTHPESVQGVLELQRDYGKSLLGSVREDLQERGQVLKSAFEQTSNVLKDGWNDSRETVAERIDEAQQKVEAAVDNGRETVADNIDEHLEQINGVGSTFAEKLRNAGIYSLAQVAAINTQDLADEDHPLHHMKSRMESEDWVQQAHDLIKPLS
ncbi:MAG: phasin family protein [Pseudomonadales bacterium]